MIDLTGSLPWRTGSKRYRHHPNHRTIYLQLGESTGAMDPMLGVMDTPELAALVVAMRAVLTELVQVHDSEADAVSRAAEPHLWSEARRLTGEPIRLPYTM